MCSDNVWSLKEVYDRAISKEEQAQKLYLWASERASIPGSRRLLVNLAEEEGQHKEKLLKAKKGIQSTHKGKEERVEDLRITDYLKDIELADDSGFQEILIFAGKKEKESYEYYNALGQRFQGTKVGKLFQDLAMDELSHKFKVERIYDSEVLKED